MFSKAESTIEITQAEKTATLMFSKLIFGNAYKRNASTFDELSGLVIRLMTFHPRCAQLFTSAIILSI